MNQQYPVQLFDPKANPQFIIIPVPFVVSHVPVVSPGIVIVNFLSQVFAELIE